MRCFESEHTVKGQNIFILTFVQKWNHDITSSLLNYSWCSLSCSWMPTWTRSSSPEHFPRWGRRFRTCASFEIRWRGKSWIFEQLESLRCFYCDVWWCVRSQGGYGLLLRGDARRGHSWEVSTQNQRQIFTRGQSGTNCICLLIFLSTELLKTLNVNVSFSQPTRFKLNRATFGKQETGWVKTETQNISRLDRMHFL